MPKKNQTFKIIPDGQIVQLILDAFGLDDLEDTRLFTREHMKDIETAQKIIELSENIEFIGCLRRNNFVTFSKSFSTTE